MTIKLPTLSKVALSSKLFKPSLTTASLAHNELASGEQQQKSTTIDHCKSLELLRDHGLVKRINHASFALLPLFFRSLEKLTAIVDHEMIGIGGQRVLLPTLVNQNLWKKSGRLTQDNVRLRDFYKVTDRHSSHHFMAPTHEEPITEIIADSRLNENKLPILLYQVSPKFRDERRPRFGLFRTNEFIMKDLYSFDATLDDAQRTYETVCQAYERVFNHIGLDVIKATSDVGVIGGLYSHEYHLECSLGEDKLIVCDSCHAVINEQLREKNLSAVKDSNNNTDKKDDSVAQPSANVCHACNSNEIRYLKGIEVGHAFLLSDKYSKPQEAMYLAKNGSNRYIEMGCYGLGLTRIIAAGVEKLSCESPLVESNSGKLVQQLRWPKHIEPFMVSIVTPKKGSKEDKAGAMDFCKSLAHSISGTFHIDVLLDDRSNMSIGRRLFDIQCLGSPIILIVGARYLHDVPKIEVLSIDYGHEKHLYKQDWLTHRELFELFEHRNR